MTNWTIAELKAEGFTGFAPIAALRNESCRSLPGLAGGIYIVLRCCDNPPTWLANSCGGWFKGKDPTVTTEKLERAWVRGTPVVYIGKADGTSKDCTLQARVSAYISYGYGNRVAHRGGRYIWQLADNKSLLACWRETPGQSPEAVETQMLADFKSRFGKYPFANLRG